MITKQQRRLVIAGMLVAQLQRAVAALRDETDARVLRDRAEYARNLRETLDQGITRIVLDGGIADADQLREITAPIADLSENEWLQYLN